MSYSFNYERGLLTELNNAFKELMNESGKIAKQDILRKYADLPYFKETLHFLYNNMIVTNISKKKLADPRGKQPQSGWASLLEYGELLNYLQHNSTGRLQDLSTVHGFISNFEADDFYPMLEGIVTKDIPLGVSAATLNKVYNKDFVPKFSVMLAKKFEPEKHLKDGKLPVIHAITEKIDGNRTTAIIDEQGGVTLMARSGKPYEGYTELIEDIKSMGLHSVVLDGEMVAKNPDNLPSDKLFTITQSITRKKGEKTGLDYWIYDMIPLSQFLSGKSSDTYTQRRHKLEKLGSTFNETNHVYVLPVLEWTKDMEVIQGYADRMAEYGKEGIMLNSSNGLYVTTRSNNLLKVKQFFTMDLLCTGVIEEIRGGTLGAIEVDYKGNTVKVGSGFSHYERVHLWENPDEIVGSVVEVQYFEVSTNKDTGKESLRFPTFKHVRESNKEVSYD